jgi:hypothetical protein
MLILGRRWRLVFCTASLPPQNSLCQNFTCVFNSVDSPYCARNIRQISLGPTFWLVSDFITTRCTIVIGTSAPLSRSSWFHLTGAKGESDGEVRSVPTPHHNAAQDHYPILLIRWLQLTEVGLYLIYVHIYRVIQEESAILWEMIVCVILSKKVHMNVGPILNGYRDTGWFRRNLQYSGKW